MSVIVAFIISVVLTGLEIPFLKRLKAGQSIREEGPQAHMAKTGTPTMGGLAIIASILVTSLFFSFSPETIAMCVATLCYGAIGFADDYIKVVMKRNLGLTAKQKIALQVLVALGIAAYAGHISTEVWIPFFKVSVDFGLLFYPFVVFVMVAMTNAVNLTDGLDGLSSSVTVVCSLALAFACTGVSSVFALSICGGCLGFLVYNHHPAKLFMGDTGSLALGAALASYCIMARNEFILPIAGGIYVLEALSVIIQVFVFKTQNGRRFFRMAPIHHHFELGGWSENRVVLTFAGITAILGAIVVFLA